MPVPGAALSALRLIVSAPLLGLLLLGPGLPLPALLLVWLLPLLLLGVWLLPILLRLLLSLLLCGSRLPLPALLLSGLRSLLLLGVWLLPILLRLLLSLLLRGPRLPLPALLLSGLRSLLLLGVRLLSTLLRLLLSMLLCGLLLRVLSPFLFRVVLFFALVLCIGRTGDSEKQRQRCSADDSNYLHKFCLLIPGPRSVTRYRES